VSVRSWLTPQLASADGHWPDSASWFDLESQGCWLVSNSGREANAAITSSGTAKQMHFQQLLKGPLVD